MFLHEPGNGFYKCDNCSKVLYENDSIWVAGRYVLNKNGVLVGHGIDGTSNEDGEFCSIKCMKKKIKG